MKIGIITYDNGRVMCIHKQDTTKGTYLVEESNIPEPEEQENFTPILYYNETNGFWYEYIENIYTEDI